MPARTRLIRRFLFTCLTFAFVVSPVDASEWDFAVEGGTVQRDGETRSRIRGRASLETRPLSHLLYIEWFRHSENEFELGYRPRYWFGPKLYAFGEGSLRTEEAVGIDREVHLLAGLGLQLIATADTQLWVEAGAGSQLTSFDDETLLEDETTGLGVLRSAGSRILSELFRLDYLASVTASSPSTHSELEVGASVRLPQGALRLSHRVRRIDFEDLETVDDSQTAFGFTIGF